MVNLAGSGGTGYTENNGSYGLFLPDIGTILLNAGALDLTSDEGIGLGTVNPLIHLVLTHLNY